MKIGRNDPCPCGSGKKFKKCCANKNKSVLSKLKSKTLPKLTSSKPMDVAFHYWKKYQIRLKTEKDIIGIKKAGKLVVDTLQLVEDSLKPGITTGELNRIAHEFTIKNGAKSATLNYQGFPKSTCISVNHVVCHGIPGPLIIKEGDILNVDVTSILDGYFADANRTFCVGKVSPKAEKVVSVSRQALDVGMSVVRPGIKIGDIGHAIQRFVEQQGCSVVEDYVGHGVGFAFHEEPQIPHYGSKGDGIPLVEGMVFTIEPMINYGKKEIIVLADKWTAITKDHSLSAQFEQTLLVTSDGFESLTPFV